MMELAQLRYFVAVARAGLLQKVCDSDPGSSSRNLFEAIAFLFECFAKCSTRLVDENPACVEHARQRGKAMNHARPASLVHSHVCPLQLGGILLSFIMQRIVIRGDDQSRRNVGQVRREERGNLRIFSIDSLGQVRIVPLDHLCV